MPLNPLPLEPLVVAGAVVVGAVLGLALLVRRLRRVPAMKPPPRVDLRIDIQQLDASGPLATGPWLEVRGIPVRLAVLVLAPVGRGGAIPATDALLNVVDVLLPGLVDVVAEHRPLTRFWPPQLSSQGFIRSFFFNALLPGERGSGTVWCSVAGRFSAGGERYLAGLVCCAHQPDNLGQIAIQDDGQWSEVLRVRR